MKFFTLEWATGELPDDEFDATPSRYAAHLTELNLEENVEELSRTNLHDALVLSVRSSAENLSLGLVTGDLQRGYFETTITYVGANLSTASLSLLQRAAGDTEVQVIADEVDRAERAFVHRFLFSSFAEAEIAFTSVSIAHSSRHSRDLAV
jgi:hypothetical protein